MTHFFCSARLLTALAFAFTALASANLYAGWTLNEAMIPQGFSLEINHRTRYEFLSDEFRTGQAGETDVVVFRTLAHGRMKLPFGLTAGAEFQDSRAGLNANTQLNTMIVNSVELLRAYLELDRPDTAGGNLVARAGRMTMNVGGRRFVARNQFRNTINSFTGMDIQWQDNHSHSHNGLSLRGFWTMPVFRLPETREKQLENDIVFDDERFGLQFWGFFAARDIPVVGRGELYMFGLHERDAANRPTRNRQLITPGFRFFQGPVSARFDYELETAFQFGRSRSSITSVKALDHYAHFHHLTLGYTFNLPWSPRIALKYDYASGDDNPNDSTNQRFDPLFGARRFEYGPTSIFGTIARANIHTPGFRVEVKPHSRMTSFIAYRAFWLASDRDAWTTSGVRDPDGRSGHFIGSQFEIRVRWQLLPGNVILESGYAHLFAGEFIDNAPNSNRQGDSDYAYTQITVNF